MMTTTEITNQDDYPESNDLKKSARRSPLFLFVLASILVHGLGMVGFYQLEKFQPATKETPEHTPIEFVEIPEESTDEPPPETQRRAMHDSVAKSKQKPVTTPRVADKMATPRAAPQPQPVTPPPTVEKPSQPPVLSGNDSTSTTQNETVEKPVTPQKTESQKSPTDNSPVATRLPPQKKQPPVTQEPNNSSAASLLGGSYERSLKDDGGGSFFESEIVASQNAPYAQLDAQQDKVMAAYFAEIRRRIKRNWSPNSPTDEYNTVLNFSIQRNGQITGLRVAKTSGSEQVDRETIEAVQNSAPFPPLPENFPFANLDIEFNFNIYLF